MSGNLRNRRILLRRRPDGTPAANDFEMSELAVGKLPEGQLRVRNHFVSIDPAMRVWLGPPGGYAPPVEVGAVMRSFAVGTIVQSAASGWDEGSVVVGMFGWQDYADVDPSAVLWKVRHEAFPLSWSLGILGINGLTAYVGVTEICRPHEGETFVVSTAAGAVGSAAGQMARILGARAVGITGSASKVRRCVETYGFAAALDYKVDGLPDGLRAACPAGIDSFFDNTAGPVADLVRSQLNVGARLALCGTAAVPSWSPWPLGERVERHLLNKRASIQGFVITDHVKKFPGALDRIAGWLQDGRLHYHEHLLPDLAAAPAAIGMLFSGANEGKLVVRVHDS